MGRKAKFSQEKKLEIVKAYLEGKASSLDLSRLYGCNASTVRSWVEKYQVLGEDALRESSRNQSYTSEFKQIVAEEYLKGDISLRALAVKHNIRNNKQIQDWIKRYNGHEELKSYKRTDGGVDMAKGRKTTYEERIEIVEYCMKNGKDYTAAATKYEVSYHQVYDWVKKYNKGGVVSLKDNRGKGKDIENMDETERLAAENRLLRAKVERLEIEIEFKKNWKWSVCVWSLVQGGRNSLRGHPGYCGVQGASGVPSLRGRRRSPIRLLQVA